MSTCNNLLCSSRVSFSSELQVEPVGVSNDLRVVGFTFWLNIYCISLLLAECSVRLLLSVPRHLGLLWSRDADVIPRACTWFPFSESLKRPPARARFFFCPPSSFSSPPLLSSPSSAFAPLASPSPRPASPLIFQANVHGQGEHSRCLLSFCYVSLRLCASFCRGRSRPSKRFIFYQFSSLSLPI